MGEISQKNPYFCFFLQKIWISQYWSQNLHVLQCFPQIQKAAYCKYLLFSESLCLGGGKKASLPYEGKVPRGSLRPMTGGLLVDNNNPISLLISWSIRCVLTASQYSPEGLSPSCPQQQVAGLIKYLFLVFFPSLSHFPTSKLVFTYFLKKLPEHKSLSQVLFFFFLGGGGET